MGLTALLKFLAPACSRMAATFIRTAIRIMPADAC
jgi:hypothetical protein